MNKPEFEFIFGLLNKQATPIVSFPAAPVAVDLPISIDVSVYMCVCMCVSVCMY